MALLQNEFSWSKSRDETLHSCLRRYWFQYYGAWGGWDWHATYRVRQIYMLKQLHNRHAWIGVRVHEALEQLLKLLQRGAPLPEKSVSQIRLREQLRQDFRASRAGKYRDQPKRYLGLIEHEYRQEIEDCEWRRLADLAEECLNQFYLLPLQQELQELTNEQWLELEELNSFELDGYKIWVSLDASFQRDDQVVLLDWKTGKAEEADHSLQMGIYALYAMDKWHVDPSSILLREVYLGSGVIREYHSGSLKLTSVLHYVSESIHRMRSLLRDGKRNLAEEDDFPLTEDLAQCTQCNFRKVCPRWQRA